MSVKILKILSMIFVIAVFSGCSTKVVEYVNVPYEVKIPVKCIVPVTHCDFNKTTDTEVIVALRLCIEDFKKSMEVCR
jgi:hypothetical protein